MLAWKSIGGGGLGFHSGAMKIKSPLGYDVIQSGKNFPNFQRNVTSQYNKEAVFTSETKNLYQTTRSDVPETVILKKA